MDTFLSKWTPAPRMGSLVTRTGFIGLKTPLPADLVAVDDIFTPAIFVEYQRAKRIPIVGIICVDDSCSYVNEAEWRSLGVQFVNGQFGSGIPTQKEAEVFIRHVQSIKDIRDGVIGVCSTTGFNHAGFFIVCALLDEGWDLTSAMSAFAQSRPPGIYESAFIDTLFNIYGGDRNAVPPIYKPAWLPRPVVDPGDVPIGVVVPDDVKTQVQNEVHSMCKMVGWSTSDITVFPGSQPVSMDKVNMKFMEQQEYRVTWKADGERYLMCLLTSGTYMIDREYRVFSVPNLVFPRGQSLVNRTLLDGELVVDMDADKMYPRYLVYDVIYFENHPVGLEHLDKRMRLIDEHIIRPHKATDRSKAPFSVRAKMHFPVNQTRKTHMKFCPQLTHPTDGFIFTPTTPYKCGECRQLLKWKPAELNTIDFVAKTMVVQEKATDPLTLDCIVVRLFLVDMEEYVLHGVLKPESVGQAMAIDGRVVECVWRNIGWHVIRIRKDKACPNARRTAYNIIKSIEDAINIDTLFTLTKSINP